MAYLRWSNKDQKEWYVWWAIVSQGISCRATQKICIWHADDADFDFEKLHKDRQDALTLDGARYVGGQHAISYGDICSFLKKDTLKAEMRKRFPQAKDLDLLLTTIKDWHKEIDQRFSKGMNGRAIPVKSK